MCLIAPSHGELDTYLGRKLMAADHVILLENWEPVAVEGDSHARRLSNGPDGAQRTLDVDVVFVELGLRPHTDLVRGWVTLDAEGRVVVDAACQESSVPGLFAAGDVTNEPGEQVVITRSGSSPRAALWRSPS